MLKSLFLFFMFVLVLVPVNSFALDSDTYEKGESELNSLETRVNELRLKIEQAPLAEGEDKRIASAQRLLADINTVCTVPFQQENMKFGSTCNDLRQKVSALQNEAVDIGPK